MKAEQLIQPFLALAARPLSLEAVFNPWADRDPENDLHGDGARVRRGHLEAFLNSRLGKTRYLLVGEALGYQGGHFSGIPLTSERMLLGHHAARGLDPAWILPGDNPARTSRPAVRPQGFTEPTATIVWGEILASARPPQAFAFWNAFAWHPYQLDKGLLSNRKPSAGELEYASPVLSRFLALFPGAQVLALGRVAARQFERMGIPYTPLRHPALGGAPEFRRQFQNLLDQR
jgi:hypothetical protein